MRSLSVLVFFLITSQFTLAQHAQINGHLPASASGKTLVLTLMNYETRKDKPVQEVKADKTGAFAFTVLLKEPAIYHLSVSDSSLLHLLVKPGDAIDLRLAKAAITSKGSADTQYLIDYEANRKNVFKKWLQPTYDSSSAAVKSGNKERIEYWNVEHEMASENYKAELAEWVKQPFFINSLAAVHHSMRWHADNDLALMDTMVNIFERKYPKYELTRQLVSKVNSTKRIAIGAMAPEFQSKNTEGKVISLKSYRGQYTLVDFWASWCGPCRQESPTLVRLYAANHEKGFTILSVSIDTSEDKWKGAIKKDGYRWENVSELNGYASATAALYNVSAIPNSFLLDKEGRIIAKNLRGKNLENKLIELLGK